jgi:Tol biopolymer transport system component
MVMRYRNTLISIVLLLAGGLAYLVGTQIFATRLVRFSPADGASVGAFGPIELTFDRPMNEASVSAALQIEPAVPGRWVWQANTGRFIPTQALQAGTRYTVRLAGGAGAAGVARSAQGSLLQGGFQASFQVRPAQVVFLSPAGGPGELWRVDPGSAQPQQMTSTGGGVLDFAASPQGDALVYAVRLLTGGSDLWEANREGSTAHLLISCAPDRCLGAAWSPDGTRIAFSRIPAGQAAQIWTADVGSGESAPLYPHGDAPGQDPTWSPDGARLAFYDLSARGLHIVDLATSAQTLIPTTQATISSWTPDGKLLIYDAPHPGGESPADRVMAYDPAARSAIPFLGKTADAPDYGLPAWSADGKWLAVGIRDAQGAVARQLWVLHGDGSDPQQVTRDALSNAAAPRWDPWGQRIVFQSFRLGGADARSQVVLWDRSTQKLHVLTENGSSPAWLP